MSHITMSPIKIALDMSGHRWVDCSNSSVRPDFTEPPPAPRKVKRSPSEEREFEHFPVRELFGDEPPYKTVDIETKENHAQHERPKAPDSTRVHTLNEIECLFKYAVNTPCHENIDLALAAIVKYTDKYGYKEPNVIKMEIHLRSILMMGDVIANII